MFDAKGNSALYGKRHFILRQRLFLVMSVNSLFLLHVLIGRRNYVSPVVSHSFPPRTVMGSCFYIDVLITGSACSQYL